MKTRLINILLLMPSVLIFLFYVSQKYWLPLVWDDFFEHKESLRHYSNIMLWFGTMILCFVGTFLFQGGHIICFIFKKDWHSFSKCAIVWSLILFLPLAGFFIAGWYKESPNIIILKSLKESLEKKNINIQALNCWVSKIHPREVDPLLPIIWNENNSVAIPDDIRNIVIALSPDVTFLRTTDDQSVYVNMHFQSLRIDLGIIVGISPDKITFSREENISFIELCDNAFIWLEI